MRGVVGSPLPDFIPIQHMQAALPQPQYNDKMYSPPVNTLNSSDRGRPGVSVMFNPWLGATDF